MHDVAIIGFGPVGQVMANLLGSAGLDVVVLEREADIFDQPRAIGLDHESLRVLQRCGITDELSPLLEPYKGMIFLGVDGKAIRSLPPTAPPYPLGWWPNATFIQPELESLLRTKAASHASVDIRLRHDVLDAISDDDGVSVTVRNLEEDRTFEITARYAIACDGARSPVRQRLGGGFEDLAFDEWWVVIDAWLLTEGAVPDSTRHYCSPRRPASYIRGPRGLSRWEIKILPGEDPADLNDPDRLAALLGEFVDLSAVRIWRSAVYRFHALVAEQWHSGRVFLAGDAAHQTPPFLGQGLNSGIRDASNLAWKLLAVMRDGADPSLFETYERERKPHMRHLVAEAKAFGLIVGELDSDAAKRRDILLREKAAAGLEPANRQALIPNLEDGLLARLPDGTISPGAGALFVQPRVVMADGKEVLLDDLLDDQFILVAQDIASVGLISKEHLDLWHRLGGECVVIGQNMPEDGRSAHGPRLQLQEVDGVFAGWMKRWNCRAAIVRPDRYVFGLASDGGDLGQQITSLFEGLYPSEPLENRINEQVGE